jgi:DNA-binding NarL/FixJ family response regulator
MVSTPYFIEKASNRCHNQARNEHYFRLSHLNGPKLRQKKRNPVSQFDFDKSHFLTSPETAVVKTSLERVVRFASELCGTACAAINIASEQRNIVKASIGMETADPDFVKAVCDYSLQRQRFIETTEIASTRNYPQPAILNNIKFYAGAIMRRTNGTPFGTLCIWDIAPHTLSDMQREGLKLCAQHASQHIELSRLLSQARNRNELLKQDDSADTSADYWTNFEALTPREKQVLYVILENTGDSSNKRIAQILDISPRTVELHRSRVFSKMQVRSAAELVSLSLKSDN